MEKNALVYVNPFPVLVFIYIETIKDDKGSSRGADTLKATTLFYGLHTDLIHV